MSFLLGNLFALGRSYWGFRAFGTFRLAFRAFRGSGFQTFPQGNVPSRGFMTFVWGFIPFPWRFF
jgi:hypothetical protein